MPAAQRSPKPRSELLASFAPPPSEDDVRDNIAPPQPDPEPVVAKPIAVKAPAEETKFVSCRVPKSFKRRMQQFGLDHELSEQDLLVAAVTAYMDAREG